MYLLFGAGMKRGLCWWLPVPWHYLITNVVPEKSLKQITGQHRPGGAALVKKTFIHFKTLLFLKFVCCHLVTFEVQLSLKYRCNKLLHCVFTKANK